MPSDLWDYANFYDIGNAAIVVVILAVVGTIVLGALLLPERRRRQLGPFGQKLHDFLNFKHFVLETILRLLYLFCTLLSILLGLVLLFVEDGIIFGLILLLVGPISIRLVYEISIMLCVLTKNTIAIKRKLYGEEAEPARPAPPSPAPPRPTPPSPAPLRPDPPTPALRCPVCGTALKKDAAFCTSCGTKLTSSVKAPADDIWSAPGSF